MAGCGGRYGKTASGKYLVMEAVDQLEGLGYDRALAAEALLQVSYFLGHIITCQKSSWFHFPEE